MHTGQIVLLLGIATAKDLLNRYLAGELLDLRSSVKQLLFGRIHSLNASGEEE